MHSDVDSPEEKELARKRVELAPLEAILAQRELDLVTLLAELKEFESLYLRVVGVLYAELDEIEARIAEAKAVSKPGDTQAQERAAEARERADESAHTTESAKELSHRPKFNPPDSLKKIYRELARILHPDLVLDPDEKARRHELMAKANRAYEEGDENLLVKLLDAWRESPETVEGDGIGAELVRIIRRIAQAEERLKAISAEIEALEKSDVFELRSRVRGAELEGRDLLAEMAEGVRQQIADARDRLNGEVLTKVLNG